MIFRIRAVAWLVLDVIFMEAGDACSGSWKLLRNKQTIDVAEDLRKKANNKRKCRLLFVAHWVTYTTLQLVLGQPIP